VIPAVNKEYATNLMLVFIKKPLLKSLKSKV
jgi:hypothetical protein